MSTTLVTLCTWQQGPDFVSSFSPFSLIFKAILSPLLLREDLQLGKRRSSTAIHREVRVRTEPVI
ncbi:hypothetical protein CCACVL1_25312 [Corchorus capsularis]|uniref:Uncharacterized protein n=1 Tax=Corchorus capsularis TaxID=210143 RepID=A0A1R3GL97_COCAP|nr:hypothetical protein CCACVL1_25312 [Corchorus capsularis]